MEEALAQAKEREVVLDDGDYLHILAGCCRGGLGAQAGAAIPPLLPRKFGYFQELR